MDEFIDLLKTFDNDEETIRKFEEKLNRPIYYERHLKKFKFNKRWFSKLDYLLVQLGYRGLDKDIEKIIKTVREKILYTNINTIYKIAGYNKKHKLKLRRILHGHRGIFMLIGNPEYIDIYYSYVEVIDYIFSKMKITYEYDYYDYYDYKYMCKNNYDKRVISYILKQQKNIDKFGYYISENTNNTIAKYIIQNINMYLDEWNLVDLSTNTNDLIVDFLIKNPDYMTKYFAQNSNNRAVEWLINNIRWLIYGEFKDIFYLDDLSYSEYFSLNTNPIAVQFLLQNPNYICHNHFMTNNSDLAVRYYLENPNKINRMFSENNNDKAVEWLLQHPDKINKSVVMRNTNINMINYCLSKNIQVRYPHLPKFDKIQKEKIKIINELKWMKRTNIIFYFFKI